MFRENHDVIQSETSSDAQGTHLILLFIGHFLLIYMQVAANYSDHGNMQQVTRTAVFS